MKNKAAMMGIQYDRMALKGCICEAYFCGPYISDWLPSRVIAICNTRREEVAATREAKQRRIEENKETQNSKYPSHGFIVAESDCKADARTRICRPPRFFFAVSVGKNALMVLGTVLLFQSQVGDIFLHSRRLSLSVVAAQWKKGLSRKKKKEWACVNLDT